jgi:hypothetical protein
MKPLLLLLALCLPFQVFSQKKPLLNYPQWLQGAISCQADKHVVMATLTTKQRKAVKVFDFHSPSDSAEIWCNDKEIGPDDTLLVSKEHPLTLKLVYAASPQQPMIKTCILFNIQLKWGVQGDIMGVEYTHYSLNSSDLVNGNVYVADVSGHCADKVSVRFPDGGSISGRVLLYKGGQLYKTIELMDTDILYLSKADIGEYEMHYLGCQSPRKLKFIVK